MKIFLTECICTKGINTTLNHKSNMQNFVENCCIFLENSSSASKIVTHIEKNIKVALIKEKIGYSYFILKNDLFVFKSFFPLDINDLIYNIDKDLKKIMATAILVD